MESGTWLLGWQLQDWWRKRLWNRHQRCSQTQMDHNQQSRSSVRHWNGHGSRSDGCMCLRGFFGPRLTYMNVSMSRRPINVPIQWLKIIDLVFRWKRKSEWVSSFEKVKWICVTEEGGTEAFSQSALWVALTHCFGKTISTFGAIRTCGCDGHRACVWWRLGCPKVAISWVTLGGIVAVRFEPLSSEDTESE